MAIEEAFAKSWETWDQFDTCDLQFGNVVLDPAFFPKGFVEQHGANATLVNMALDNEGSVPIVEVYFTEESLDKPEAEHTFEVTLVRKAELEDLKSQLAKFRSLVHDIDSSLPSGLDSFLDSGRARTFYNEGRL